MRYEAVEKKGRCFVKRVLYPLPMQLLWQFRQEVDYGYSLLEIPVIHSSRSARSTKQNYSTPRNSNIFGVVRYTLEVVSSSFPRPTKGDAPTPERRGFPRVIN